MAERKAKFENRFSHVWADEAPGITQFSLTVDLDLGTAQELIGHLFKDRIISDVIEVHRDTTLKVIFDNPDGHLETHTEPYKYLGVVSEERVEELVKAVDQASKNHTRHGKFPPFELYTHPIATGNKNYIAMEIEETLKEKPDKEELLGVMEDYN